MKIRLFTLIAICCLPIFSSTIVSKDDLAKAFETDYKQAIASSQWQAEAQDFNSWYSYSSSKLISTYFGDLFPLPPTLDPKSSNSPAQLQKQLLQSLWNYAGNYDDDRSRSRVASPNFKQGGLNDLEAAIVGAKLSGISRVAAVSVVPKAGATVGNVPEPATVMLLGCGMVVLGLLLANRSVPVSTHGPEPPDAGRWHIL